MSRAPLVVVGDVLLDVDIEGGAERLCPDAPAPVVDVNSHRLRPGGAGLAALLAARTGREVVLLAGLGNDDTGRKLAGLLGDEVSLHRLPYHGDTPSKSRVRVHGQTLVRMDSGAGTVPDEPPAEHVLDIANHAAAVLVADYGRGTTANTALRRALANLPSDVPLVWDPHPNGTAPLERTDLVVPNRAEATGLCGRDAADEPAEQAAHLRRRWGCGAVAVTLGAEGALLVPPRNGQRITCGRPVAPGGDVCGAGDSFAAGAALALAAGADPAEAVTTAVRRAAEFVADGGAAPLARRQSEVQQTAPWPRPDAFDVAARVRAAGGRLVATGGCFDLLHPGHVRLLERAREFGDALIVCLNSDASVRGLKGPERPIIGESDRVRLLHALQAVDAVAVFDESSPSRLLDELRPDVWIKGGDYHGAVMPEAEVVARHGGRTAFVPLTDGYSTSRLLTSLRAAG